MSGPIFELNGPFKLVSDGMTIIRLILFGPKIKAGQTWYTNYRDHYPATIVDAKGLWVTYKWQSGQVRKMVWWNFRSCYCMKKDLF